jgi:hypothetical protein
MTIYSPERRFAFKSDCGSRPRCFAARQRWRRETKGRLARVEFLRAPDLWTFTARTKEQDELYLARRLIVQRRRRGEPVVETAERLAPLCRYEARDHGDPHNAEDVHALSVGLSRVIRFVTRQVQRQLQPNYENSHHARCLREQYGTDRPLRGRPGASLRIRVKEAGERNGRLHEHVASDFDFIHHGWLKDAALRCGLGFPQYSRKESTALRRATRFSGPSARGRTIAHYLSGYLGKGDSQGKPWPWPPRTRLLSSARGVLPKRTPAADCRVTWRRVAAVAVDLLGAEWCDWNAVFWSPTGVACADEAWPPADG